MDPTTRAGIALARFAMIAALALMAAYSSTAHAGPTPEEYVQHVGPHAKIIPPGQLKIDGLSMQCGHRPTVIDEKLDDYGAAYPGFLILNPRLLKRTSPAVKLWIHAHECAHQFRGPDEETADCFAVQRGRRMGWLTPQGLEEVCEFIRPARGSAMHLSGSHRCEAMRRCYESKEVK